MEVKVGVETCQFYEVGGSSLGSVGKRSLEWDLNDWRWDGNLFIATPVSTAPLECGSKHLPKEADFGIVGKGKGEAEKRRRILVVEDNDEEEELDGDGAGSLALNLGGNDYPVVEADLTNWEGRNGKMSKPHVGNPNRAPSCQVDGCAADLRESKDYHRRHKVCEVHSKASMVVVKSVQQRFCQQCSRFHLLQEFDEGKRSCRRRLAGHNRRRRKTHPDATANANPVIDDQSSSFLLISLLQILSNLHSDNSNYSKDQNHLSHVLKTLAGGVNSKNQAELLQTSQAPQELGPSAGATPQVANGLISNGALAQATTTQLPSSSKMTCTTSLRESSQRPVCCSSRVTATTVDTPSKENTGEAFLDSSERGGRLKDFDLNCAYSDTQNFMVGNENAASPAHLGTGSPVSPSCVLHDSNQSSPPNLSANSDSMSVQSLSSFSGDAQSRTDRIVFKLFGKDPNDFPLALRSQVLDWLSHSPTDIESYIRPGCIILTIYLRLAESAWEELCSDLTSSLNRLLSNGGHNVWRTGWVYARIQDHIAFIYNGKVLFNAPRLHESPYQSKILFVTPIAAALSSRVSFTVKGVNIASSTRRLLCAFEGKYLVQETTQDLADTDREHQYSHCIRFSCLLPNAAGRGFIEVEDYGLSSCFFPFIVADDDACTEIQQLENVINVPSHDEFHECIDLMNSRNQALNFVNELGWLLQRNQLRSTSNQVQSCVNTFSLTRFRWLMVFAVDKGWCAVVKKLLDILFQGSVDVGGISPDEIAVSEGLLHSAVRKNCKHMVESLLRYRPETEASNSFLFRPDAPGPSDITPLHVAASLSGNDSMLDALTDDPGQLGLEAWKNARDATGFTPEDYARSRGFESYLQLVQKKINKQRAQIDKHVLDIPSILSETAATAAPTTTQSQKQTYISIFENLVGFEVEKKSSSSRLRAAAQQYPLPSSCNLCSQQMMSCHTSAARTLLYRPAMLSMVGIAAVCVCVGLIFKGPPEVSFLLLPFRWERLSYGSI